MTHDYKGMTMALGCAFAFPYFRIFPMRSVVPTRIMNIHPKVG